MSLIPEPSTPHLILGAAKSGKSAYAEQLVAAFEPPYVYVATAQILDAEMEERVRSHRARRDSSWLTIEASISLISVLQDLHGSRNPVLVDCLTLWLSNLLLSPSAHDPFEAVTSLCDLLPTLDYPLFFVANEVGGGIVPDNPLARSFRDLAGIANQQLAKACKAVTLVVAGLPMQLK
jgi:adenosylcobinamide kinase/adenosylcobinamide-phosphate guanylyltransferase